MRAAAAKLLPALGPRASKQARAKFLPAHVHAWHCTVLRLPRTAAASHAAVLQRHADWPPRSTSNKQGGEGAKAEQLARGCV